MSSNGTNAHVDSVKNTRKAFGVVEEDENDATKSEFVDSISVNEEVSTERRSVYASYTAPKEVLSDFTSSSAGEDPFASHRKKTVADNENEYVSRHRMRGLSPARGDSFQPDSSDAPHGYADAMREQAYEREKRDVMDTLKKREADPSTAPVEQPTVSARKRKWDMPTPVTSSDLPETPRIHHLADDGGSSERSFSPKKSSRSEWDDEEETTTLNATKQTSWDETPQRVSRWDDNAATPSSGHSLTATPKQSRWDSAPKNLFSTPSMTPSGMAFSSMEMDSRLLPWKDEDLDRVLPTEGYIILSAPASYVPIRTPARKLLATPMHDGISSFSLPDEQSINSYGVPLPPSDIEGGGALPSFKEGDTLFFGQLLEKSSNQTAEQQKERLIMTLLLKIKNGDPPARKTAIRQIVDKARVFGAGPLFDQILPILMSGSLEEGERHVLVKVLDRLLFKLDDLVRPFVHKIIVVTSPLLLDANHYVRTEGSEIIANLAKAAGLATMIAALRPDIDHSEELVRNLTAKTLAVVASALGLPALLPFIKAVCKSKKSWQARHTGIKLVLFIAQRIGCAVLPHLKSLVECIQSGITDEQSKVRTVCALGLAALAEASNPYGIESFDDVLKPLWRGIRQHRGKGLAAFLKAFGSIIPLMDSEFANYYTREVMTIAVREFSAKDAEVKRIVLRVVQQCAGTPGVMPHYLKEAVLPDYFLHMWTRESASTNLSRAVVDTTVSLSLSVGTAEIIKRLVVSLKDTHMMLRKMTMECLEKIAKSQGLADVDERLELQLMDALLFAFQGAGVAESLSGTLSATDMESVGIMLRGFGAVIVTLDVRTKPYLSQIAAMVLWRLNHKQAIIRQQSSDLMAVIAPVMMACNEEALLLRVSHVIYEALGEVFPDVLGSLLNALKSIVSVVGMTRMVPSIKDLLPRLTPILKNRHERVQEHCIELVGRIADRGSDFVSPREWMRICFELLDLLKAPKKSIRRAAINTFGYIAQAIGPHDVLSTLLNNLKVQERTNRVCTTVAIAIVAETCSPFTVLPALMNEYRVPELNVQNGVLKSLAFLFEYVGEMGRDYIYAVIPLLQDALIDRDLVHRQLACNCIKHMALGAVGLNCEDAMIHLLNYVWPNIFETSPHLIQAVLEALEALKCALGADRMMQYLLQGLFHPARKVREVYWRVYNTIYLANQEALVPTYPRVLSDSQYIRKEMEYIL